MIESIDLGLINYNDAWKIQEELRVRREKGEISDTMLLLEHPPVFTLGKSDCDADVISTREEIALDGIDIIKTNRGGRITYHGPGQLVVYFIYSVKEGGIKNFVHLLEEILISILADFGIEGVRDSHHPGIWVGGEKIAAIGLHVSRGITEHGLALNVNCDLSHYRHIIPCGIQNGGVTSMEVLLGKKVPMNDVKKSVLKTTQLFFGRADKGVNKGGLYGSV